MVNVLLNYFAIRKISINSGINIKIKNCLNEKSILYDFALPAFLATVMVGPVTWICNTILVNKSGDFSEMGLYNVANQWMLVILFLPATLSTIILPLLTNINSGDNLIKYKQILKYNIILNVVIASILCLFVSLCSGFIVNIYGEKFIKSQPVLITLAFTAIFIAYNNVIGQALASKNKMWVGLYLNIFWAFAIVFLTFFFVDKGEGALGFAKANILAYFLHSIIVTLYYKFNS